MRSLAGEHQFIYKTTVIAAWLTYSTRIQGVLLMADWILIALAAFYASGVQP